MPGTAPGVTIGAGGGALGSRCTSLPALAPGTAPPEGGGSVATSGDWEGPPGAPATGGLVSGPRPAASNGSAVGCCRPMPGNSRDSPRGASSPDCARAVAGATSAAMRHAVRNRWLSFKMNSFSSRPRFASQNPSGRHPQLSLRSVLAAGAARHRRAVVFMDILWWRETAPARARSGCVPAYTNRLPVGFGDLPCQGRNAKRAWC